MEKKLKVKSEKLKVELPTREDYDTDREFELAIKWHIQKSTMSNTITIEKPFNLGRFQKLALKCILDGGAVFLMEDYSKHQSICWMVDADGNDIDDLDTKTIERLEERGIVKSHSHYRTENPLTETFKYTLVEEFKEMIVEILRRENY